MENSIRITLSILVIVAISIIPTSAQYDNDIKLANEYFVNGETAKALSMYTTLAGKRNAIPTIHTNYFTLLINELEFDKAEKYLRRVLKYYPTSHQYKIDLIFLYKETGKQQEEKVVFSQLKKELSSNQYQLNFLAQSFVNKELFSYGIEFLQLARRLNGRPAAYALDLATVYRMIDDKESMVNEYLFYALANPSNLNYIKNIFQNLFSDENDLSFLEKSLIRRIQKEPDVSIYSELLIWIELQRKNFYGAFLQARALDKRSGTAGDQTMRIGQIAMDNKSWEDAVQIFEYVVKQFGKSYNYGKARRLLITAKEGQIKSTYPVNSIEIRALTIEYQKLFDELGPNPITLQALRSKALLHAFHLDEKQIAIETLNEILKIPRVSPILVSQAKLDLGDIYLLQDEPWEASLLYSQVEKLNKDSPIGYEAKLRNAKLNYYIGSFSLALSHLNILKQATTREISNDAIALSLLIKNNTILDTSDFVMKEFADIELLNFQNKTDSSIHKLKTLVNSNPGHSIIDECYWKLAEIMRKAGSFEEALVYLEKISNEFSYDILSDDADFMKAEIAEVNFGDKEKAKALYREFLTDHPGSMYAAEARKRFRILRGDDLN